MGVMKRLLLSIPLALIIAFGVAPSGIAHADTPKTLITGYVFKMGKPMPGMTVVASCGRYFADADITDATGAYLTSLPTSQCGWGSDVELMAISATDWGTARGMTYRVNSKLNIANTPINVE